MKFKLLVLSMLAVSSLPAFASDGDITFIGVVTASACALNGFNGGTTKSGATMILPPVTPSSFSSAGGYAGMTDFTIDLKDCDITTLQNAQVTFSGSPDTVNNEILKNGSSTDSATGVGVALLEMMVRLWLILTAVSHPNNRLYRPEIQLCALKSPIKRIPQRQQ